MSLHQSHLQFKHKRVPFPGCTPLSHNEGLACLLKCEGLITEQQ